MRGAPPRSDVPRETLPAWVDEFTALLQAWTRRINLISRQDASRLVKRHIEDSLELAPLVPDGVNRGVDLGSGAGFPGLILAKHTGHHFDLVEADHRKAAFLREAARLIGAPATVHAARAETLALPRASLVTARALAPLLKLLPLAERFLQEGGAALLPKGPSVDAELTGIETKWQMRVERFPSRSTPGAVILRITELRRAAPFTP